MFGHIRYIWSRETDFVAFVLPILLAVAFVPSYWTLASDEVPLSYYLMLVVSVLVHACLKQKKKKKKMFFFFATLFRTYLDKEACALRWRLFYLSPPAIWCVCVVVHTISVSLFWSCVAYFAIYHFISQNYGLLALYKARWFFLFFFF